MAHEKALLFLVCLPALILASAKLRQLDHDSAKPGEYIAILKHVPDSASAQRFARLVGQVDGARLVRQYAIGERRFALIRATDDAVHSIAEIPYVDLLETNQKVYLDDPIHEPTVANVPIDTRQKRHSTNCLIDYVGDWGWGIVRTSHRNNPHMTYDPYIHGEDDGHGVDIYVLDTGLYHAHTDFDGRASDGMVASGVNENEADINGHGTHVAGTAAGKRFGIARRANVISCKVMGVDGWGDWNDVIEALEWAVQDRQTKQAEGASARSVALLSLASDEHAYAAVAAMQAAIDAGIVVVVAAGNHAQDACNYTPSRLATGITVGSTSRNDTLLSFSNFGPCVNMLAAGEDVTGPGISHNTEYVMRTGTSLAASYVAGMAARLLSVVTDEQLPIYTPAVVRALLIDQATSDAIELEGLDRGSTPNKLLYKDCQPWTVAPAPTEPTTTTPIATTTTTTMPPLVIPTCPAMPADTWNNDDIYGILTGIIVVVSFLVVAHIIVLCGSYKIYKCS